MDIEFDVNVEGVEKFRDLRKRLKDADRDIRLAFLRAVRHAVNPLKGAVRSSALERLPRRGGLAQLVSESPSSVHVGMRAVMFKTKGLVEIKRVDQGRLRHPVFGRQDSWVTQPVTPGFWTIPTETALPGIHHAVVEAIDDTVRKIENG